MGMPFGVFFREHILTWDHLQSPYSYELGSGLLELKPEQKTGAIVFMLLSTGIAAGAFLVLNRSRTTLLLIAGGTALVTFYAVTGYFKWCLTQPPADRRGLPPGGSSREPRHGAHADPRLPSRSARRPASPPSDRTIGFATPGSPHTKEDFREKPDWLVPQRTSDFSLLGAATSLRRENERKYFASLWKKIYEGSLAAATHWTNYSHLDDKLKSNTFEVEEGAPWEAFARFAQKHIQ
jgi:hypothetical protein